MRKTAAEHKTELIDGLAAARANLLAVAEAVPAELRDAPCIGTWCVKDVLAHLIGWDFTNRKAIEEILCGQRPSFFQFYDPDWQSYNARLVIVYRIEPFEALRCEAEESHRQLVTFLTALTPQEIMHGKAGGGSQGRTVTVRNLLLAETKDEQAHAGQIRAFLKQALVQKGV